MSIITDAHTTVLWTVWMTFLMLKPRCKKYRGHWRALLVISR